jgi:hypothetical protein
LQPQIFSALSQEAANHLFLLLKAFALNLSGKDYLVKKTE